jgi:hypothetical protein
MLPVVAIDVPSELAPAAAESAVGSCENAIGSGGCPLVRDPTDRINVAWYATVRSDPELPFQLRIDFRSHSAAGPTVAERTLIFSETDPLESRWASVGLIIAGLVAAQDAAARASPAPERRPPQAQARHQWWWGVDAGALTGPGADHGAYRVGALARAWTTAASGFIGAATLRYAERSDVVALTWWSLSTGVGVRLGPRRGAFGADLVGDLVVERMFVSTTDQLRHHDTGSQNRIGARIGANASLQLFEGLRLLGGVDASALTPAVDIAVKSSVVATEPTVRFALSSGLRLEF